MGKYDPQKDNGVTSNLAQDLVCLFSMAAFAISSSYSFLENSDSQNEDENSENGDVRRFSRSPRSEEDRSIRVPGSR